MTYFTRTLLLLIALLSTAHAADTTPTLDNASLVREAFDRWRDGRGSVFDLLADDVVWTVAGNSPVSGLYRSRQDFLERAVAPITSRLSTTIVPDLKHIIAHGDDVVAIWEGTASAVNGRTYTNSYAWHLVLEDGKIVRVTAFLDTWALDRLMK